MPGNARSPFMPGNARAPLKPMDARAPHKDWSKYTSIWRSAPRVNYGYGRSYGGYGSYGRKW